MGEGRRGEERKIWEQRKIYSSIKTIKKSNNNNDNNNNGMTIMEVIKYLLTGFKFNPQYETHTWHYLGAKN